MENTEKSQPETNNSCIINIGNLNDVDEQINVCPFNENGCYLTRPENNNL